MLLLSALVLVEVAAPISVEQHADGSRTIGWFDLAGTHRVSLIDRMSLDRRPWMPHARCMDELPVRRAGEPERSMGRQVPLSRRWPYPDSP